MLFDPEMNPLNKFWAKCVGSTVAAIEELTLKLKVGQLLEVLDLVLWCAQSLLQKMALEAEKCLYIGQSQ